MQNTVNYYSAQSDFTTPGKHEAKYAVLPHEVKPLVDAVQGLLIHPAEAELYGVKLNNRRINSEEQLRTAEQMLDTLFSLDPSPIVKKRDPENKLVGICRDHCVLLASFLRYRGIPSRVRSGFAGYFDSDIPNETHNILEYFDKDENRWVAVDPQVDEKQAQKHGISLNTMDIEIGRDFLTGAQAWKYAVEKRINPDDYGYNKKWKGMKVLKSSLMQDFSCMNKIELLPWDIWGEINSKGIGDLSREDRSFLDETAFIINDTDDDVSKLVSHYDKSVYSDEVNSKLKLLGISGNITYADTGGLSGDIENELFGKVITGKEIAGFWDCGVKEIGTDGNVISIRGAIQNNLKNVDVDIEKNKLTVITGVSGSGKSSLAFDTVYAEGRRLYMQSVSSYARRFIGQSEKPHVRRISGISPTIAIEQKSIGRNPRSTVGSITDIYDYLRMLFSGIGIRHCPSCGRSVEEFSPGRLSGLLSRLEEGTHFKIGPFRELESKNYTVPFTQGIGDFHLELEEEIRAIYSGNGGKIKVEIPGKLTRVFTDKSVCPYCDIKIPELKQGSFNHNGPDGACPVCGGLGVNMTVDPELIITDGSLSLLDGASPYYGNLRTREKNANWMVGEVFAAAEGMDVDLEKPWNELPREYRDTVLYGSNGKKYTYTYEMSKRGRQGKLHREVSGAVFNINRLFKNTNSEEGRAFLEQFMRKEKCGTCGSEKIGPEARYVTVDGKRYPEISSMSVGKISEWINALPARLSVYDMKLVGDILPEINQRLNSLLKVGLHYLTLDREAPTLSGGEGQRIRLATQLGSGLSGIIYVLDEPSAGLHPADHEPLIETMLELRNGMNTVIVVEHDEQTMKKADAIIDMGPGAGMTGGEVISSGSPQEIMSDPNSLTGKYLSGIKKVAVKKTARRKWSGSIRLYGACKNNLKNVDVEIPLGVITSVTGVSGSGKSSLVAGTLFPALSNFIGDNTEIPANLKKAEGFDGVDRIINVNQAPIGRNSRSNPATYTEIFDDIRKIFAGTEAAKKKKFKEGWFSFNSKNGQCDECGGLGEKEIEMQFMPDVKVLCPECNGKRYKKKILDIEFRGRNIADVLDMEVGEAYELFLDCPALERKLKTMCDVGLEYIKLGQSAVTLSGGEAQRLKLVKELGRESGGKTLYILDEPTTGLHFEDIGKLLGILDRLADNGNTVLLIEHNMDVVAYSDWVIDMGPVGGVNGGYIVGKGTPEDIAGNTESATGKYLELSLKKHNIP